MTTPIYRTREPFQMEWEMVAYPIRVPRKHYGESKDSLRRKAARHNSMAKEIEDYINKKIAENDAEIQVYLYGFIAADLNLREDDVRDILYGLDAGHNGLTIRKGPLD